MSIFCTSKLTALLLWVSIISKSISASGISSDVLHCKDTLDLNDRTLTVYQYVNLILHKNINIRDAYYSIEAAKRDLHEARASFLPSLQGNGSFTKSQIGGTDTYTDGVLNTSIASEITVFDGLTAINKYLSVKYSLDASKKSKEISEQDIIYRTVNSYLTTCLDSEFVLIEEKNATDQKDLLKKIAAIKNSGQRPLSDFLSQKVYVAQSDISYNNAVSKFTQSVVQLNKLTGDSSMVTLRPVIPAIDTTVFKNTISFDSLVTCAQLKRIELQKQFIDIRKSEIDLHLSKCGLLPVVTFGGNMSSSYSDKNPQKLSRQLGNDNIQKSVYLSVTIPLLDRISSIYTVSRANLRLQQAKEHKADLENKIAIEIHEAYRSLELAKSQHVSSVAALQNAAAALDVAVKRYDAGLMGLNELYSAYLLKSQSKKQEITSSYAIVMQIITMGYLCGDINSATESVLK